MIKKIYTVNNPSVSQDEVDSISVNKFKEMSKDNGSIYTIKEFIDKVLKEGWDRTKTIAKIIEEKDVQSLDYLEFTSREIYEIRKSGFPKAEGVDLIYLNTSQTKIKIAKYYGGIFCLTYYDKESDMIDSILMDNIEELCDELKFFADEEKKRLQEE